MNFSWYIDPQLIDFANQFPEIIQNLNKNNYLEIRKLIDELSVINTHPSISIEKKIIKDESREVPVYIYSSEGENKPVMLWIHWGWFLFWKAQNDFCLQFARDLWITIVSVDYRLAPEYKFPAWLYDCFTVLKWIWETDELNINKEKIIVWWDSAWWWLAASLCLYARDNWWPKIWFQYLLYPMLDKKHDTISWKMQKTAIWNRKSSLNAWEMYLPDWENIKDLDYASATHMLDKSNLPETFITVWGSDLFRDECINYAQDLMSSWIPVELNVVAWMYHAGETFLPNATVSKTMAFQYINALKNYTKKQHSY